MFDNIFWAGILLSLTLHIYLLSILPPKYKHVAVLGFVTLSMIFVGSKIGRKFLGIREEKKEIEYDTDSDSE
jgi:hypothetical protein